MSRRNRKRKIPVIVEENDETSEGEAPTEIRNTSNTSIVQHGPMFNIMYNVQMSETCHNKYVKEMQKLYNQMDHDAFIYTFIRMIKSAMQCDEQNEYATTMLMFCAKYASSYEGENTHPVLLATFDWVLSTVSSNPHIRYRLCQFTNMILRFLGYEAALDDHICDRIMSYMICRLRDLSPNVRVQAILALQRLQVPDNPDDIIVKTYQFHLTSDPSPKVRQAVISSIGRNYRTIPFILERLWDIDEKVRRHTYLQMSSYPAKSYKVAQRLTLLEQGLNDRCDGVRKVVTTVMLPQWLESYNKNIISFISSLKLDANEEEIIRFRKIAKMAVGEIFKRSKIEELVEMVPLEPESEFEKCVPLEKLSIETTLFWLCLIEYLQTEIADEIDRIIPELSTFCAYVSRYCNVQLKSSDTTLSEEDSWQMLEHKYTLLTLVEILSTYDLGDEIGRENLKQLLGNLIRNYDLEENTIKAIIKIAENLIELNEDRFQFFVDIVTELVDDSSKSNDFSKDRTVIDELLEKHPDLKLKISTLRVKILDLEEQEMNFVEQKDYVNAQRITEEKRVCSDEYARLLNNITCSSDETGKSLLSIHQPKRVTPETTIKCLQISFYMVCSKKVKSLAPNVCALYKDYIRRQIESSHAGIRDWALKCGTAYSLLYDQLSKDVFTELYSQFYKNHIIRLWKTCIECIFELLDRYGLAHFDIEDKQNKSRKPGRQLYNTNEFLDGEDDNTSSSTGFGVDLMYMMSHFLDTCEEVCIYTALIHGFCRLILHGHIKNDDIMEKLLLKYFNPATEPEINQRLGVFFENLIKIKRQEYLQLALLPTVSTILGAPYDSPLREIKPETVLRFVIDSTRSIYCTNGVNIHNTIASSFLLEMQNNIANKELLRILSKELVTLEISVADDLILKENIKTLCEKLLQCSIDTKIAKYIENFRDIIDGIHSRVLTSTRNITEDGLEEDNAEASSDEEDEKIANNNEINHENIENNQNISNKENPVENSVSVPSLQNAEQEDQSEESLENEDRTLVGANNEDLNRTANSSIQTNSVVGSGAKETCSPKDLPTPTTFGTANTPNLRYLRKSLHSRQTSTEEEASKKVRTASEGSINDSNEPQIEITTLVVNTPSITSVKSNNKSQRKSGNDKNNSSSNDDDDIRSANSSVDKDTDSMEPLILPESEDEEETAVAAEKQNSEKSNNDDEEIILPSQSPVRAAVKNRKANVSIDVVPVSPQERNRPNRNRTLAVRASSTASRLKNRTPSERGPVNSMMKVLTRKTTEKSPSLRNLKRRAILSFSPASASDKNTVKNSMKKSDSKIVEKKSTNEEKLSKTNENVAKKTTNANKVSKVDKTSEKVTKRTPAAKSSAKTSDGPPKSASKTAKVGNKENAGSSKSNTEKSTKLKELPKTPSTRKTTEQNKNRSSLPAPAPASLPMRRKTRNDGPKNQSKPAQPILLKTPNITDLNQSSPTTRRKSAIDQLNNVITRRRAFLSGAIVDSPTVLKRLSRSGPLAAKTNEKTDAKSTQKKPTTNPANARSLRKIKPVVETKTTSTRGRPRKIKLT